MWKVYIEEEDGICMTAFIAHCNKCDEDFEYRPYHKNSTIMFESESIPVCPKCKKISTIIVRKILTKKDKNDKSIFGSFKEGTENLEQRRLSY